MPIQYQNVKFAAAYGTEEQLPFSAHWEISFVGRSNVGKSSIMNKIFSRKSLVKVSQTPGKTSTINFFNVGEVDFVDLPGYGYARVSQEQRRRWRKLIDGYFRQNRRFALAVLLVDIRHDVSKLDLQMCEYLNSCEIPYIICFTKADKLSKNKVAVQVPALCRQLSVAGDAVALACSAVTGQGVGDLKAIFEDAVLQAKRERRGLPVR